MKTTGDGLLLEFASVVDAVRCAVDVQRGMAERNAGMPAEKRIDFRIGINVGDIIIDDDDIFGDGVNVAARLEALADPGGIYVSRVVRDQVRDKLNFTFEDLGSQEVKNIARPVEVFRVDLESAAPQAQRRLRKHWQRLTRGRPGRLLATGLVMLCAAGIAAWVLSHRDPASPKQIVGTPIASLAVLPLANLSGDPNQEYFADGMTDALITELAKISALKVISRTSVMQYKGAKQSLPDIARALGVDGIIEGSVLREGEQVKITVQLISAPSDTHLWAQEHVRDLRDILSLQSDVARSIAKQVKAALTPGEVASIASPKSVNPAAYDLYLRAKTLPERTQNVMRAIEFYEQATVIDPGYASAFGALGYTLIGAHDSGLVPRSDAFPRAQRAADRAIELDPEDLDAIKAQFAVTYTILRDYSAAERIIRRVLERAPNDAPSHSWLSRLLSLQGRFDEAIAEARRAVELDPQSVTRNSYLAEAYYGARKFDDCIEQAHRSLNLDPNAWGAYGPLSDCYDASGRYEEGAQALQRFWVLWGEDPGASAELVTAQSRGGYPARVRSALAYVLKQSQQASVSYWGAIAVYYALLGDKDRAFAYLDRAYREFDVVLRYVYAPEFDSLRDDPRWLTLLRRLNLDQTPVAKLPAAQAPAAR